jgi:hypothetical protein
MKRNTQKFLSLINRLDALYDLRTEYFVQRRPFLISEEDHFEVTKDMEKELDIQIKVTLEQLTR